MSDSVFVITFYASIAAASWFIIGTGAAVAVFSKRIKDTFCERCWLSLVCLVAWGTAFRILDKGFLSTEFTFASIVMAGYVLTVMIKHIRKPNQCLPQRNSQQVLEVR